MHFVRRSKLATILRQMISSKKYGDLAGQQYLMQSKLSC